ncbi:unnamed protein product [Mycena citricolor]|uniref:AB hydrolase-1 domain-containing protein n=1 Tax=Mycena citricolor TaxID=2018698 RepID=A0AAD2HVW7_9AGAR|nr:unnamed protein product [Mycena citricolor]
MHNVSRFSAQCALLLAGWLLLLSRREGLPFAKFRRDGDDYEVVALRPTVSNESVWNEIVPSSKLLWTDCYGDKQCARLLVPLDYGGAQGRTAAIALVRLQSVVSHHSNEYRGPILLNPGGPGGSGVDFLLSRGAALQKIVGDQYDMVGFDPRGISRSTPRASFFLSRAERALWETSGDMFARSVNESASSLADGWARGILHGQLAGERDVENTLQFINTDHTARDMLSVVHAHGFEKLNYWGFSYGSVLGASFAAMFPDKVEGLIIDGVADSYNYFALEWSNNLIDADINWASFASGCVTAGPEGCPFYSPSTVQITDRLQALYNRLLQRPIPVRTAKSYGLVDFSKLRRTIFSSLYSPYAKFLPLAAALADLERGNATALWEMSEGDAFECGCDPTEHIFDSVGDGGAAVLCNDGARMSGDFDSMERHYHEMLKVSEWADVWEPLRMQCLAWPNYPKKYFNGPFIANTSHPILLIGNTADPVTPLWAANNMSTGFTGSVVLTQDSVGLMKAYVHVVAELTRQQFAYILPSPGAKDGMDESHRENRSPRRLVLPPEIWDCVLSFINSSYPATLHACSAVCRAWVPMSRRVLYDRGVNLSHKSAMRFVDLVAHPLHTFTGIVKLKVFYVNGNIALLFDRLAMLPALREFWIWHDSRIEFEDGTGGMGPFGFPCVKSVEKLVLVDFSFKTGEDVVQFVVRFPRLKYLRLARVVIFDVDAIQTPLSISLDRFEFYVHHAVDFVANGAVEIRTSELVLDRAKQASELQISLLQHYLDFLDSGLSVLELGPSFPPHALRTGTNTGIIALTICEMLSISMSIGQNDRLGELSVDADFISMLIRLGDSGLRIQSLSLGVGSTLALTKYSDSFHAFSTLAVLHKVQAVTLRVDWDEFEFLPQDLVIKHVLELIPSCWQDILVVI